MGEEADGRHPLTPPTGAAPRARVATRPLAHAALVAALAAVGCQDPVRPMPVEPGGDLVVESIPAGGAIIVDRQPTGRTTPDTLTGLAVGPHEVLVALDSAGFTYRYVADVTIPADAATRVRRPLTLSCDTRACAHDATRFHQAERLRFALNAAGPALAWEGVDQAILWPASTGNSYAALGAPLVGGLIDGTPVALGVHDFGNDLNYWHGLPAPLAAGAAGDSTFLWSAWIAPSAATASTIRGMRVSQQVATRADRPDAVLIRVRVRNVSADPDYRLLDPLAPDTGFALTQAWIGFALDADVGAAQGGDDDLASYDADRSLVFAYDGDMSVGGFTGGWDDSPGLVGLQLLAAAGTATRLNAWPGRVDWVAGQAGAEEVGYALLRAAQLDPPDDPDPRVGFAPDTQRADYTISVASGPLTLAPGDSAEITVAVLLAAPEPGTYTSGALLPAGAPADPGRPLAAVAAGLFELADSLTGMRAAAPR